MKSLLMVMMMLVGIAASAAAPSGTLPIIYINVYKADADGNFLLDNQGQRILENEIIDRNLSHKNYFQGEYWLDVNGCQWLIDAGAASVASADSPLPLEIKGRGNWTLKGFSKKPFKIKLGKKQNLLGLTPEKSKHYALLAHADDAYGYMRNFVGFNLGHRIGLPWTPSQQPVELVINGDYRGLYFLTESIRVGDGRVPITELEDNASDPSLISGGYLVELDNYDEENQISMTEKSAVSGHHLDRLRITFDTPEVYSEIQRRFVTEQFSNMNNCVGAKSDVLWSYLDLDDAVRYYLVREIISDVESYHGSTYLFRDRGEGQKWHFSPIWDCGNAFNGPTEGFFYDNDPYGNTWIPSIRVNSKFNEKLTETWKWFMSQCYDGIYSEITEYADHIAAAAVSDRERWRNEPAPNGGIGVLDNSNMTKRRDAVLSHLRAKTLWLQKRFGSYAGTYPEPERDTAEAAPLPSYAQSGVDLMLPDQIGDAIYYDLQGNRVERPAAGRIYIRVVGSKADKVRF